MFLSNERAGVKAPLGRRLNLLDPERKEIFFEALLITRTIHSKICPQCFNLYNNGVISYVNVMKIHQLISI